MGGCNRSPRYRWLINLQNNVKFKSMKAPRVIIKATEKLNWIRWQKTRLTINKFFSGLNYLSDFDIRFSVIKVLKILIFYPFWRDEGKSKVLSLAKTWTEGSSLSSCNALCSSKVRLFFQWGRFRLMFNSSPRRMLYRFSWRSGFSRGGFQLGFMYDLRLKPRSSGWSA